LIETLSCEPTGFLGHTLKKKTILHEKRLALPALVVKYFSFSYNIPLQRRT